MAHFGHDRIGAVRLALLESARVNMDVGDHGATSIPAVCPKSAEPAAINLDYAGL